MSRPTLATIARSVGVDVSTVSYALAGKAAQVGISPARVAEIRAVADRLGYRPNAAARATRSGRFGAVGLLLGARWTLSHLPRALLEAVQLAAERHGQRLVIARLGDERLTDPDYLPGVLRELATDGLLVAYNEGVPSALTELVARHHLPSVWLNARLPGTCCVHPVEISFGARAVSELLARGHRSFAWSHWSWSLTDPAFGHFSVSERRAGFDAALAAAGLPPAAVVSRLSPDEPMDFPTQVAAATRLLRQPQRPTALVCYAGDDAEAAAVAALRLGLRVPEDLSLIGVDDAVRRVLGLELTTFVVPNHEMGQRGADLLMARINDPLIAPVTEAIPLVYHSGETVASAPPGPR